MPRPLIKKILFGLGVLIVIGAVSSMTYFKTRHSASLPKGYFPQSIFTSKGMSARTIQVTIKAGEAAKHDEVVEVQASVTMPFTYSGELNYRWKFGDGVTQMDGVANGQIQNLIKGEAQVITIKVKGFGRESNHQLGFEVNGNNGGYAIYGDALIASDLENTFENTVQNVERIKANQ